MTARLEFVRLLVADLSRAIGFYRDVLGLALEFDDGEHYAAFAVAPGFGLSLFGATDMRDALDAAEEPAPTGDRAVLVLAVDDVDGETERLRGLGVPIVAEPTDRPDWGIRTAHLRDPDGHLLEINQPLPYDR